MWTVFIVVNIGIYCLFSVNSAPTVLNCSYESNGIFFIYLCKVCFFPAPSGMCCQSRLNYICHGSFQKETRWLLLWLKEFGDVDLLQMSTGRKKLPCGHNSVYLRLTSCSCHGYSWSVFSCTLLFLFCHCGFLFVIKSVHWCHFVPVCFCPAGEVWFSSNLNHTQKVW